MEPNKYLDNSQEKEINLSDLIWKLLGSWRLLICMAVIFCILAGGYKFAADTRDIKAAKESKDTQEDVAETELTDLEEQAVDQANRLIEQIRQQQEYLENSVLMQIDPNNKNVATMLYYVDTNYEVDLNETIKMDYAPELVEGYASYIKNGGLDNKLYKVLGWDGDLAWFHELITLGGRITNANTDSYGNYLPGVTFTIYLTGENAEKCQMMMDTAEKEIAVYQKKLSKSIGEHELVLVDSYLSVVRDASLASSKENAKNTIISLQGQLANLKTNMNTVQLSMLESGNDEDAEDELEDELPDRASVSKKYLLLGFLLGGFLGCGWIALRYIFDKYIKSAGEVQSIYGVRIFGEVSNLSAKKKRVFSFVDKWLDSLHQKEIWSREEQMELINTNLRVTCEKSETKKLLLTTSLHLNEEEKKLVQEITSLLNKNSIEVVFAENMVRNAKTFETMAAIGQVVLLEKAGATMYTSIEKELQLCIEQNAQVLGTIIIQ